MPHTHTHKGRVLFTTLLLPQSPASASHTHKGRVLFTTLLLPQSPASASHTHKGRVLFTTPQSLASATHTHTHTHTKVEFCSQPFSCLSLQPVPHLASVSSQCHTHTHTKVEFCSQPFSCLSLQPEPHTHTEVDFTTPLFLSHSLSLSVSFFRFCVHFTCSVIFKVWPLISVLLLSITF